MFSIYRHEVIFQLELNPTEMPDPLDRGQTEAGGSKQALGTCHTMPGSLGVGDPVPPPLLA